jgi:hypothetical protein
MKSIGRQAWARAPPLLGLTSLGVADCNDKTPLLTHYEQYSSCTNGSGLRP